MPVLNVGECAQKVADIAALGLSRSAPARSLVPLCRISGESTFDWVANEAPEPRPTTRFSPEPVALVQVTAVVRNALAAIHDMWPTGARAADPTEILLLAGRVQELDVGLYLTGSDGFTPVTPGSQHRLAWVRSSYGDAPVLLLVCGDLPAALSGDCYGYQALLHRAGLLGHALWLSAAATGLASSISGRPHSQVTAATRQLGDRLHHLLTVAVGRARPDRDGPGATRARDEGTPAYD
jgi:hypothetical protein